MMVVNENEMTLPIPGLGRIFDARSTTASTDEGVSTSAARLAPSSPPPSSPLPPLPDHLEILASVPKDDAELARHLEAWRKSGGAGRKWLVYSPAPATAVIVLPPPPPPPPPSSPFPQSEVEGGSGSSGGGGGGGSMVRRGEILTCLEWLEAVGVVSVVAAVDRAFGDLVKSLMFIGFSALSSASAYCTRTVAPFVKDFALLKADLVDS
ncbi:hypothetical protein ECG_00734 [Echinococcus granulosus]|uniref:Expressed conserved protein n=1 Tax=Echinococcus granulosus TaxID=6210 RepID=A0A068WFH2_ECHGR|nr:hypothetical protein ECG_00734 [Echinococcus granulosus]CDS16403.1 hypothetical protein EgrG_000882700 [Echinococcus granulosus]